MFTKTFTILLVVNLHVILTLPVHTGREVAIYKPNSTNTATNVWDEVKPFVNQLKDSILNNSDILGDVERFVKSIVHPPVQKNYQIGHVSNETAIQTRSSTNAAGHFNSMVNNFPTNIQGVADGVGKFIQGIRPALGQGSGGWKSAMENGLGGILADLKSFIDEDSSSRAPYELEKQKKKRKKKKKKTNENTTISE